MPENIQDQVSRLYCKFHAPLIVESQVSSTSDLIHLTYNYDYKLVWVNDERTFFYLMPGLSGQLLSDWQKWGLSAQIFPYNNGVSYDPNICVHYNGALYVSLQPTMPGILPTDSTYWIQVSGNNATIQIPFTNQTIVYADVFMESPIFDVYINDSPIEAHITKTSMPGSEGGFIWKISFYENQKPSVLSGYIIVK
jgi:hypothetical protein